MGLELGWQKIFRGDHKHKPPKHGMAQFQLLAYEAAVIEPA